MIMPVNRMLCLSRGQGFASVPSGNLGAVAQLARAPALQAGGRRFDSDQLHKQNPLFTGLNHNPLTRQGVVFLV